MKEKNLIIILLSIAIILLTTLFGGYILYNQDRNFKKLIQNLSHSNQKIKTNISEKTLYFIDWYRIYSSDQDEIPYQILSLNTNFVIVGSRTKGMFSEGLIITIDKYGTKHIEFEYKLKNLSVLFTSSLVDKDAIYSAGEITSNGDIDIYLLLLTNITNISYDIRIKGKGLDISPVLGKLDDGSIVMAFSTKSFITNASLLGIIRISPDGDIKNFKLLNGSSKEIPVSILDVSNNYWIIGETKSYSIGENDIFIIAFDKSENTFQWMKAIGTKFSEIPLGAIKISNEIFVYTSSDKFNILKLDTDGNLIWIKKIKYGNISSMYIDNQRRILFVGNFFDKISPYNIFLAGSDLEGNILFRDFYSFTYDESPIGIYSEGDSIYIFGSALFIPGSKDIWAVKLKANTNISEYITNQHTKTNEVLEIKDINIINITPEFFNLTISVTNKENEVFSVDAFHALPKELDNRLKGEIKHFKKLEKIKKKKKK